jgi:hypothetical protein
MSLANIEGRHRCTRTRSQRTLWRKWFSIRAELTRHMYVSCWYCTDWESAAMWHLYGSSFPRTESPGVVGIGVVIPGGVR